MNILPVLPAGAKILLVGEAPGAEEEKLRTPFVGASGRELDSILSEVGIPRYSIALTNVFMTRPPNNDLQEWGTDKRSSAANLDPCLPFFSIRANKLWLPASIVQPALARLASEIAKVKPNLIVALGNTALSALTGLTGVGRLRGTLQECLLVPGIKVIPTYHPAAILRNYEFHAITVMDFMKIKQEAESPNFNLLNRAIWIEPTISDLEEWKNCLCDAEALACDIETKNEQITCIGFAPTSQAAYVIPFWDRRKPGYHYWHTIEEEIFAWQTVQAILSSSVPKIFQNGLYDLQYILKYGWHPKACLHDTMLLHHSLYPMLPKGLDFLGSLYANERAWKKMRPRGGEEKREA